MIVTTITVFSDELLTCNFIIGASCCYNVTVFVQRKKACYLCTAFVVPVCLNSVADENLIKIFDQLSVRFKVQRHLNKCDLT